jgi:cobalt-zinc-cadmium efflux system membrane fusion protein
MKGTYAKHFVLLAVLLSIWGCDKKVETKKKSPSPAEVHNKVKETDLTTITLTEDAVIRLGIQTAKAEYRILERTRMFGGEVMAIPGQSVTVSAPLSGTLLAPADGLMPKAGEVVTKGQPLYRLLLALPEKDLLSIQEEAALRKIELDLAQGKVKRAEKLLDSKAGSIKQLEEAQAELASAQAALQIAEIRSKLLTSGELDVPAAEIPSLIIKSPVEGIIQKVYAAPGQTVTSAANLAAVTDMDPVWIRVPVYVGDLAVIDKEKPAQIQDLADITGAKTFSAAPVESPLSADSQTATVDLFYELANREIRIRPGQKVSVRLMLTDRKENLVVPYASILYDMYGSAWLYENTEPRVFVRRRVEVRHVQDKYAILSRGCEVGVNVVTAGAAELFGTEFGVGK